MPEIKVSFIHPTDSRSISVAVDSAMTASEAVAQLIAADFIAPNPQGYNLAVKGGAQLRNDQSFLDAGVKEGDALRILPATDAGR